MKAKFIFLLLALLVAGSFGNFHQRDEAALESWVPDEYDELVSQDDALVSDWEDLSGGDELLSSNSKDEEDDDEDTTLAEVDDNEEDDDLVEEGAEDEVGTDSFDEDGEFEQEDEEEEEDQDDEERFQTMMLQVLARDKGWWDSIKSAAGNVVNKVVDTAKAVANNPYVQQAASFAYEASGVKGYVDTAKTIYEKGKEFVNDPVGSIKKVGQAVKDNIQQFKDNPGAYLKENGMSILKTGLAVASFVPGPIGAAAKVGQKVVDIGEKVYKGYQVAKDVYNKGKEFIDADPEKRKQMLKEGAGALLNYAKDKALDYAKEKAGGALTKALSSGPVGNLIKKAENGVLKGVSKVSNTINDKLKNAPDFVKNGVKKLETMAKEKIKDGFSNAISDATGAALDKGVDYAKEKLTNNIGGNNDKAQARAAAAAENGGNDAAASSGGDNSLLKGLKDKALDKIKNSKTASALVDKAEKKVMKTVKDVEGKINKVVKGAPAPIRNGIKSIEKKANSSIKKTMDKTLAPIKAKSTPKPKPKRKE